MAERRFPIRDSAHRASVPWRLVEQHFAQAERNQGRTLEQLAEAGGLSWSELAAVLEDRSWAATAYPASIVLAAVETYRLQQLTDAIEAVLLFYSSNWSPAKAARWEALTGENVASTKSLCDYLRRVQEG